MATASTSSAPAAATGNGGHGSEAVRGGDGSIADDAGQTDSISLAQALSSSGASAITDKAFAQYLDSQDPLLKFRNQFRFPTKETVWPADYRAKVVGQANTGKDEPCTYLAGNSLGLMPVDVLDNLHDELESWGKFGVLGHTDHPTHPWVSIDELVTPDLARLVGAKHSEVACMGSLTANIHALFTSFYRPTPERHKIMYEAKAFPSDEYAFASHVALHDFPPSSLLAVAPRKGEYTLRTSDILQLIENEGDSIAVICFGALQYYSGQLFDMEVITKAGHAKGCLVAFDLAHAIGNVPLQLHDWGVDFAAWCSYKYLNSGPGAIAGLYVHTRHEEHKRLQGWWGHDSATRFQMPPTFAPLPGAAGWQFSNPSVIDVISLNTSLEIFQKSDELSSSSTVGPRREKSVLLTNYLEALLKSSKFYVDVARVHADGNEVDGVQGETKKVNFTIITPSSSAERGAQLSLLFTPHETMPVVMDRLREKGVLGDERQPGVIRFAPVPLYNNFKDVLTAATILESILAGYSAGGS